MTGDTAEHGEGAGISDETLDRALLIRDGCREEGIPAPAIGTDGSNGLTLTWRPGDVTVELTIAADGNVIWVDPARPTGITFDVFSPAPFIRHAKEWYTGGPVIGGQRITVDEIREIADNREPAGD